MNKNFFQISDLSKDDINAILRIEASPKKLAGKNIGLLFEKYSTRTRLSFSVGIHTMGGNCIDLRYSELNISRAESFEDTFRAFNCYLDGLVFRTNDHQKLMTAAQYFNKPIINRGSCIFIHLTKNYRPTAGCIALKERDFLIMLKLLKKNSQIKII